MTDTARLPRQALTALLSDFESAGAVTLKNGDIFANFARGGDWDVLVPDLAEAERRLIHHLGAPDRVCRRSYVHSYFFPWGEIDLLPDWLWRGARLIDRGALVAAAESHPTAMFPVVGLAHEAAIGWFNSLLWGGVFNARYQSLVERAVAEEPQRFQEVLETVFGARWRRRLWALAADGRPGDAVRHTAALRRSVARRAVLRNPLETIVAWLRLWRTEVALRRRPVVPWIWVDERRAAETAEALRNVAAEAGQGLAGVTLYQCAGGFLPLSLFRALLQYWGPLVKDRVNGQLVVFVPRGSRPRLAAAYARLCSPPDLDLTGEPHTSEGAWSQLHAEMQRRTAALVARGSRLKARGFSSENEPEGRKPGLGGDRR
jgi:hypothetical protein